MTAMLSFDNVELYYDQIYALKGVSLTLQEGETVALIGANGAGKSSILRAITGLAPLHSGQIHFMGQRLDGTPTAEIVKKGISMVPEGRRVFPFMSVKDNLLMGAFTREDKAGIARSLEQQMMVIGRALMGKPRMLLLDEPSLGIAPKLVQDIARAIVAISRDEKVSVLLVEQNSRMALSISNRAYALSTGKVVLSGDSRELMGDERIKAAYLGAEV